MNSKHSTIRNTCLGIISVLMIFTLYMIFLYAPVEKEMGIVQKIFYLTGQNRSGELGGHGKRV